LGAGEAGGEEGTCITAACKAGGGMIDVGEGGSGYG
jgi:hypothetical protein